MEELNERLLKQHDRFLGQYFIPTKIHPLNADTTDKIFNTYEPDLTKRTVFDGEIVRWKAKRAHVDPEDKPVTLQQTLAAPIKSCILMLRLSSPSLSRCPCRQQPPSVRFSTMRRVKTYMRPTMRAERLSGLAILHAYRDRTIDNDKVVDPGVLCHEAASIGIRFLNIYN